MNLRHCKECGKPFSGSGNMQVCSDSCRVVHRKSIDTEKNRRRATRKRALWPEKKCPVCGSSVVARRSTRVFCSLSCRQKARYARLRAALQRVKGLRAPEVAVTDAENGIGSADWALADGTWTKQASEAAWRKVDQRNAAVREFQAEQKLASQGREGAATAVEPTNDDPGPHPAPATTASARGSS